MPQLLYPRHLFVPVEPGEDAVERSKLRVRPVKRDFDALEHLELPHWQAHRLPPIWPFDFPRHNLTGDRDHSVTGLMSMGDICNRQIRTSGMCVHSASRTSLDPELLRQLPPGYGAQAGAADRGYMSSQTLLYLVLGVAVLGLLIYRQLIARPVRGNQRIVLILLIVGLLEDV